ncbi:hypothetical protein [Marinoscillum sp.]|uniref:hypothetical protein n=1 Tax=Marinoscillum sp. TaxID=2024838 RepID=UPI003BAD5E90
MENNELILIGASVLAAHRIEFLTQGLVAHFKNLPEHKQFKNLNPRVFLDDTESNKKLRRQTLGQIFRILSEESSSLTLIDELDKYLQKRNLLIHDFWRTYYRNNNDYLISSEPVEFCKTFLEHSAKLEDFFKGLLYLIASHIANLNNHDIPRSISSYKKHSNYFRICLQRKKLI